MKRTYARFATSNLGLASQGIIVDVVAEVPVGNVHRIKNSFQRETGAYTEFVTTVTLSFKTSRQAYHK